MSDKEKMSKEDWKKLEDEAYYELMQIIAEAMQLQDIELLNSRIAAWKTKYKKLLDRPATDSRSDFKKRIEFLLNQYYSEVTKYILNQLKLNEKKKIENQAKAMKELYVIIRDTNDTVLLKKKIAKWKEKYPVDGFLSMYQKRIAMYTRKKNIEENAFNQEEAFNKLVDISKIHGTYDELKEELSRWEKEYSINDKFTIDDFIKHQSEVKRFVSDEFLISIARDDVSSENTEELNTIEQSNKGFSDLSKQANAYTRLLALSSSPNNINEMFKWVYKNRNIKFNDKYKEMILSATYLDYSPALLNKLEKPNIDLTKNSLSFEEYKNITDIKRYAIISYFNLLLPQDKAIANDFFNKNVQLVYSKSEKARMSKNMNDNSTSMEDLLDSGVEVPIKQEETLEKDIIEAKEEDTPISDKREKVEKNEIIIPKEIHIKNDEEVSENKIEEPTNYIEIKEDYIEDQEQNQEINESEKTNGSTAPEVEHPEVIEEPVLDSQAANIPTNDASIDSKNEEKEVTEKEPQSIEIIKPENKLADNNISEMKSQNDIIEENYEGHDLQEELEYHENELVDEQEKKSEETSEGKSLSTYSNDENLDYNGIVAFSPLFIATINNLDKQAVAVSVIDRTTTKYVESEKEKENSLDLDINPEIKNENNYD